jgi:hypothetical protein
MATFATEGHQGRQPQPKLERPHAPISDSKEHTFKSQGFRPLLEKPNPYEKEKWYIKQQEELKEELKKAQDRTRQIVKEQQAQVDAAKKKKEEEEKKKKGGS